MNRTSRLAAAVVTATDGTFASGRIGVATYYAGPAGRCVARNNVFTGAEPGQPDCGATVEEPRTYYDYTLDDPNNVRTVVMAGAGVGKI